MWSHLIKIPELWFLFIVMILKLHNHNLTILCAECATGYYGTACLNRCGHCFEFDVCFHINGSCPGNCSEGFKGDKCYVCKLIFDDKRTKHQARNKQTNTVWFILLISHL